MADALLRIGVLIAIFASVFVVSQLALNTFWARRSHLQAVNKRLRMLRQGNSREDIMTELRKNVPRDHPNLPPFIGRRLENIQRTIMATSLPATPSQVMLMMAGGFAILVSIGLVLIAGAGFPINPGVILLTLALAFCITFAIPMMALSFVGQRRRKRIEQQFPVALDIFVRALRAGHPIASAIDLLTREMEDPIGSEFGLVGDEVAYGAELTEALSSMAERWDLDDIRMFVVSLSVQSETGGNLAEILQNLSEVIRARASLYMKVRALSSEGRMTGWMLSILPIAAFVGLFTVNPGFYLSVASDSMFITGAIILATMYTLGFVMIRKMIDIKV
jgi:tight adherence protein B